ncbi:Diacylglycerol kinase/PAP2 family protein-Putative bifunctional membrane-associated kinase and phosphatase [Moritella viscosa]|uniref:Diacylglycerol kinase/PAP2 family protein-Putative bifunctional membrane-associated kinase and phosphatase n=1 Tax=Moritella viscosa TaxID=80854 RepID=A0A1L0APW0_9GAMM|nr:Diacylglycerol kinase/PAP2 family protein-Putative bifunctional membrane-associated kinase and phosphatase [Moritella viscosa]SHN99535.1 Diacylglycerol kinase/PAP2 family protein-Putative bifunctional membrane-associated kinase and phosphatase [Moritella viscosa]SHO15098.1 Diacylglycerol kinase/PAP2 family protein-Putative bifunctional membrane-associated kinase and phosphatase [Moritella viscosa]SHO15702.1 Diacylglycerol kinase/PAP2 family protein-Putative bifunctional membrane-associated ki
MFSFFVCISITLVVFTAIMVTLVDLRISGDADYFNRLKSIS